VLSLAAAAPADAQYDREGRYVPSPMGVPQDPTARPIPNYPGTPGGAIGTPWEPPLAPSPPLAPMRPRVGSPPPSGSAPISTARCESGWSPKFRMSKAEFEARCRKLLRARKTS
jgi:hypothetical protein